MTWPLRHNDFSVLCEEMSGGGESAVLSPVRRRAQYGVDHEQHGDREEQDGIEVPGRHKDF
jgi:hypothetical protein